MPLLACGEYRPHVSDYEGQPMRNILSVIRGDSYRPRLSAAHFLAPGAFSACSRDVTRMAQGEFHRQLCEMVDKCVTQRQISRLRRKRNSP